MNLKIWVTINYQQFLITSHKMICSTKKIKLLLWTYNKYFIINV